MTGRHPSQARIMRAVRGAALNASDAHPNWRFDRRFAHSIAKRAAGTLTAEWPDVLAARLARRQERKLAHEIGRHSSAGTRFTAPKRSPLKLAWQALSREVGHAKRRNSKDVEGLIAALKIVAALQSALTTPKETG